MQSNFVFTAWFSLGSTWYFFPKTKDTTEPGDAGAYKNTIQTWQFSKYFSSNKILNTMQKRNDINILYVLK